MDAHKPRTGSGDSAPAAGDFKTEKADEWEYEDMAKQLDELQAGIFKLRSAVPNLLRGLAHIDEAESTSRIFNKIAEEARQFYTSVNDVSKLYNDSKRALSVGKQTATQKVKTEASQKGSQNGGRLSTSSHNGANQTPTLSGNTPGTGNVGNFDNTSYHHDEPSAFNDSFHSGAGFSQDEPIIMDDSMSFVQF